MTSRLHPTAVIDPRAEIGPDVVVGPYAVIGPRVVIGESSEVGPHAVLERDVTLGRRCFVGAGTVLGGAPQDLKYRGEPSSVVIGDEVRIREYTTVNRGTAARGVTSIGAGAYVMSYVHVAHDCAIGAHAVIANAVQLAGHVTIGDHATLGGQTPVHQFVRIGTHAFVGGGSRLPQDVPPYTRVAGSPLKLYGINVVGLRRAGFPDDTVRALQHAFRLLFNSRLTTTQAIERLRAQPGVPEVETLVAFVAGTERGILVG